MHGSIIVQGLGKKYSRYQSHRPRRLKELLLRRTRATAPAETLWPLRDISFTVESGRMVGVVGQNGAGKSTLLRLIGGVGRPDEGSVQARGRIGALLDLGAGLHPDLTGRDNIFVNGVIAGLTRKEVRRHFESIVAFAELEDFIDSPLRTYSTGMRMRLAFAVAVHIEPEILLIDEVLSVGDLSFQNKCQQRIAEFKAQGCTMVLVSHELEQVQRLCDEVVWLRRGRLVAHGEPKVVVGEYIAEISAETRRRTPDKQPPLRTSTGVELRINENRFGSLEMEILSVRLLDARGFVVDQLPGGEPLLVEIEYLAHQPIRAPIFGIMVNQQDGRVCCDLNSEVAGAVLPTLAGRGQVRLTIERLDLCAGQYYLDVAAYEREWSYCYDYHWRAYPFEIRAAAGGKGCMSPPQRWTWCSQDSKPGSPADDGAGPATAVRLVASREG